VRIQGISQTGVPGAEQISLGAISSAAQAKMKTTQALTKVVGDYEAKVQKAEQEAEMHSASIGLEKDTQALMQSLQDSDAYDANGKPTYGGIQDQFKKNMEGLISKHRENLSFPSSKVAYNQSVEKYSLSMTGKVNSFHRGRQTEHLQGELTKNLNHYELDLENGLDRARSDIESKVAGSVVTPSQGESQYDSFRSKWQAAKVSSDFGVERASGDGQAFLDSFIENPPVEMPVDEQLSLQSRMNTLLKQDLTNARIEAKAVVAIEKERQKGLEKTGLAMANQLKEGQLVTDVFIDEFTAIANEIADPEIQKEMAQSLAWSSELRDSISSSSMAELNSMKQAALGGLADTLEESEKNQFVATSIERVMSLVKKDPQLAAVQMGILKPQINTLQDAIDNNNLKTFIQEMEIRKGRLDDQWGIDSSLFSESDTSLLAQMINKKDSNFLGSFIDAAGQKSYDVLENLLGKVSDDKVILGTLMAQEDGAEAVNHVTKGMKLKPGDILPSTADMSDLFEDRFTKSGLYPQGDANYRMGMMANIRYVYASMSADVGDYGKVLDEDRMNNAMDLVMQKPIEMKGDSRNMFSEDYYTFPARRSMTEKDMNTWKLSLPVSTFDSITGITEQSIIVYEEFENGRAANYSDLSQAEGTMQIQDSSSYIKSLIDSNTIQIRSFGEQGRYYLMWNNQTLKSGNENFVLEYK